MPIQPACCLIAVCAECGYQPWDGHDLIPHYATLAEAKNALSDWEWLGDIPLRCGECTAAADCATYSHAWSDFHDCQCHGTNRGHETECPQLRWCTRCAIPDYAYPPAIHTARQSTSIRKIA